MMNCFLLTHHLCVHTYVRGYTPFMSFSKFTCFYYNKLSHFVYCFLLWECEVRVAMRLLYSKQQGPLPFYSIHTLGSRLGKQLMRKQLVDNRNRKYEYH